jgi:nucleoside-diphosphate-sugar epimerase
MLNAFGNVVFSIEKARRVMGYHPSVDFVEGMERTAAWIQWARL